MAITRAENQVTFSAANSVSVSANSSQTSDAITLDATCIAAQVSLKADNAGTPAAADKINVYLLQTSGDPDGASSDEYDTAKHGLLLATLDTSLEDPAMATVPLPIPQKGAKLLFSGTDYVTTQGITVSATITEQRAA